MTDPNWSCLVLVNTQEVLSRHLATVLRCAVLEWRYRNQSRTEFCSLEISKSPWMQCWALCSGCPWWGRVEPEGPWSASKLNHLVVLWFSAFNPGFPAGWVCSIALSTHCGGGLGVLQLVVTYGGITVTLQHLLRRHIHRLKTSLKPRNPGGDQYFSWVEWWAMPDSGLLSGPRNIIQVHQFQTPTGMQEICRCGT